MRYLSFITLALLANGVAAQELEFVFDEPALEAADTGGPDLSFTLGTTYGELAGTPLRSVFGRMDIGATHDLGALGYLEWAATARAADAGLGVETAFALNRLTLQNSSGDLSWKIGKYRIGWGEVEGAPVLDVVNGALSLDTVGAPGDELPGQWFLGADYFAGSATVSAFVNVAPEVAHALPAAPAGADYEVGAQVKIPFENGEASLYAARLLPQAGVVNMADFTSYAEPYTLLGFSANRAAGDFLFEIDVAAKSGLQRSTLAGLSPHDRIDVALGVEYAASNTMQITAALMAQRWTEQTAVYYIPDPMLGPPIATPQESLSYMLSVRDTWLDGKLSVSANLLGSPDGAMQFTGLSASYAVSDAWKIEGNAGFVSAAPGTPFSMLDGMQQFGISATYYY